jgi:hypothetical protein
LSSSLPVGSATDLTGANPQPRRVAPISLCYTSGMTVESERPRKDPDRERPVPLIWRPVLHQVVEAIRRGDPRRAGDVPSVVPVSEDVATQVVDYLDDYGETLVELPANSWATSRALWMGDHWEVLVDLWTEGEGRSDLALHLRVFEVGSDHRFEVGLVYVP